MKLPNTLLSILLISILSCQTNKKNSVKESKDENKPYSFFVGTYTDGESEGIYRYSLAKDGKLNRIGLVAKANNPSFLAKTDDHKFLVAANEISNKDTVGRVSSYLIQGDSLLMINSSSSGGAHPCHVAINDNGYVLAANYTGGNVGLLKLNSQGELTSLLDVQQHSGSDIADRQEGPHAHSAWFAPEENEIISVDLGTNELWFSHLDNTAQKLVLSKPATLEMEPGAGPRHIAFHPNGKWIYVLNELNATVTLVQKTEDSAYKKGQSISTLPKDFNDANTCADIHITADGKFVYASNRGHNSIVMYSLDATDGSLNLIGFESTRGDGPRNFSLSPDEKYLLVANQHSQNIISFKRDKKSGKLEFIDEIVAPTPVCILF